MGCITGPGNSSGATCAFYEPYTTERFILILGASGIAAVGCLGNALLLAVLLRKASLKTSQIYLASPPPLPSLP